MSTIRQALLAGGGDPLGVACDPQLSFAIADAAARRFITADHSEESLQVWRDVVVELARERVGGDTPESIALRGAWRFLVGVCQEWLASGGAGTPTAYLSRALSGERDAASVPERSILAHTASILMTMAWGTGAPPLAQAG